MSHAPSSSPASSTPSTRIRRRRRITITARWERREHRAELVEVYERRQSTVEIGIR